MNVEILTPDQELFQGEADIVTLPGQYGSFQIKRNHAAMISNLQNGEIIVAQNGSEQKFEVKGGLVEVLKNKIVILV